VGKDRHPAGMRRVTVSSVTDVLLSAGVPHGSVQALGQGWVRIDVVGRPGSGISIARERVAMTFEDLRHSDFWTVRPAGKTYRWRPWRTWVTICDPGIEWTDSQTGLNFFGGPVW
jgi:hypothetical protein